MIHLPFNLPSRSTKSIQPRVFVFHLEYTTASYFTRKNVELNITWALGHDRRLFTEQTVASIIGSITAPLLFWGGVECVLEGLRWKVELKGMTVCDGHRDNEALMDLIGCSLHCSTLQSKCQASENTANTTVFLAYSAILNISSLHVFPHSSLIHLSTDEARVCLRTLLW